jgi:general secretion pathway protein M
MAMRMREWFDRLAPRERLLVTLAAVLTLFAVVVVGGLRPLAASRTAARAQLADKQAVLADIERVAARFGPQAGGAATPVQPTGESLVVLVDRTTRSRGLAGYLKRNEPDGNASIRLRFENAPFDDLIVWLAEMQTTQGIGVVTASADPSDVVGRVSANLQLSRAVPR